MYNLCFKDPTTSRSDLKCKENRQYDEYIPYKTQKYKGIHLTVLAEIISILKFIICRLKNTYWELILDSLIFCKL